MQFLFSNLPSQQPVGELQKQNKVQTPVTKDNKRDSNKTGTDKTNKNALQ